MAWRFALAAGAALATAPAALATDYRDHSSWGYAGDPCAEQRGNRQAVGAVVGGVVGGLLGNAAAGDGDKRGHYRHRRGYRHHHSGGGGEVAATALGAIVGAAVGAGIAGETVDCGYRRDYRLDPGYRHVGWGYQQTPYGYERTDGYGDDWPDDETLEGAPYDDGYYEEAPAAAQCETVYSITRLPDGTEIRKPVQACREAHYGEWEIED
ncbi:MAG: hypothetical protein MI723_08305 [Caulobacterales bacterium]|nr:hypothetical protein [Caulobacterales bacterium]